VEGIYLAIRVRKVRKNCYLHHFNAGCGTFLTPALCAILTGSKD